MPRNLPSFNQPEPVVDMIEILILPPRRLCQEMEDEQDEQENGVESLDTTQGLTDQCADDLAYLYRCKNEGMKLRSSSDSALFDTKLERDLVSSIRADLGNGTATENSFPFNDRATVGKDSYDVSESWNGHEEQSSDEEDVESLNTEISSGSVASSTSIDPARLIAPTITFRRTVDVRNRDHYHPLTGDLNRIQHRRDNGLNQLPDVRKEFHRIGWARRRVRVIKSDIPLLGSHFRPEHQRFGGDYLILLSKDDTRQESDPEKFGPNGWNLSDKAKAFGSMIVIKVALVPLRARGQKMLLFLPLPEGLEEAAGFLEMLATMAAEGTEW